MGESLCAHDSLAIDNDSCICCVCSCFARWPRVAVRSKTQTPTPVQALPTTQPTITISQADTTIGQLIQRQSFSGSILVASHGNILLDKGYGMADWQRKLKNTPQTQFAIGDMTKAFTATAILMLQQQGKLNVQDSVCKYISACPATWQPITIQMLLTNTSGIARQFSQADLQATLALPLTPDRNITYIKKQPLDSPPGAAFTYNTPAFIVLGTLIQVVSGFRAPAYVTAAAYEPYGSSRWRGCGEPANRPRDGLPIVAAAREHQQPGLFIGVCSNHWYCFDG